MKIGFILGSFDPITSAHVTMVAELLNEKIVDKVVLVIAKQNPWKKHKPADFELRCAMAQVALAPFGDKCCVSRDEEDIEQPAYSYKVLEKIRKKYPIDKLYLVVGMDVYQRIDEWKEWQDKIEPYYNVIAFTRQNVSIRSTFNEKHKLHISKSSCNAVSSTLVRDFVKNGKIPYPMVCEGVMNIIKDNKLYTE